MSRRASRHTDSGGSEFILECKAAYLCIYDDVEDKIESKKRLNAALQQTGRNPNRSALDKYWPTGTSELYFDDFVEICRKEPVTSSDDLMKAFRKIDINGDGYISLDELYKIMNAQGESMSRDEVRRMIDEVDDNKDGKLDYREFTNMIMKTTEDSKKFSMKVMEKKERKKKRAADRLRNGTQSTDQRRASQVSQRSTQQDDQNDNELGSQSSLRSDEVPKPSPRVIRRDGSSSKGKSSTKSGKLPDPKSLKDWMHYTSKGCFFYEEDEIVTHVYSLKMTTDSAVYISANPIDEPACLKLPGSEPIDTAIFVFDDRGKLIHCSEARDIKGTYGIKCELTEGEYQILPYTTGCRFKQRSADQQGSMKEAKLVKTQDDKVVITSKFRQALEDIFDLCDLDDNGTMSKDEFNWFNLRTSGEELGEDEWDVVEERTELQDGEITKQGFIALNEMEAEDAQGDVEDLWITLTSMGMNKALIMDEVCPYRLDVHVEEQSRKKPSLRVSGIESLDKKEFVSEICNYTMEKAGDPVRIRNMKDLYLYQYKTEHRATIVVDNRSRSNVNLEVDCSKSKNVASNRPELDFTLDIDPQETAIAHHLMPRSELQDWSVSCSETIHK